ncbi:xylulokinase [Enterovibrio norvegicus]|uniref:xylulokinase n=2 Tax=Enterovibrio norvegicus TaxID=188144 RepID=UPI0013D53183|nr:xylulokinase [Enterovibrio norvegicus]
MNTYLGIDIGTSAVKVLLVSGDGTVLDSRSVSYGTDSPQALWNEQTPSIWWHSTLTCFDALRERNETLWQHVAAIGLSGQMHGAVCLDSNQEPVYPAILWNDGRAHKESADLNRLCPDIGYSAGVPAMPGFTAPKLLWLHDNEPDIFARIDKVILPKDYVRLMLTGACCTDVSDAAGTLWLNEAARDWDDDLLSACHLTRDHMPTLIEGNQISGSLLPDIAKRLMLSTDVIVAGGAGDASAGGIGIGAVNEGDAFLSLGTSGQIFVAKAQHSANPQGYIHAFAHALPDRWCHMACLLNGASPLLWFSSITSMSIEQLLGEAEATDDLHRPVFFMPYLNGERTPHNNPFATGSFEGLTAHTSRNHMTQAILEGIAFSFRDCLLALENANTHLSSLGAIGGGVKNDYWLQMLADVLNLVIHKYDGAETGPALGAARLAILSHTTHSIDTVCPSPAIERTFTPNAKRHQLYAEKHTKFTALFTALAPTYG